MDLPLRCACGALTGALSIEPAAAGRVCCHCDDCRAYARWLGGPDLLDAHGGTEIVQTWPARVRLSPGAPLALVRLSATGLHRWYAGCCRSPIANTLGSARAPFVGVIRGAIVADEATLAPLGPSAGIQGRFAPGGCPPGVAPTAGLGVIAASAARLARGWWAGAHTPSPFFDAHGQPVVVATILDPATRRSLAD